MNVVSVLPEQTYGTCANCGSALVSDQRYCLECGAPVSPVRLAFLDVLQSGQDVASRSAQPAYDGTIVSAAGVLPAADRAGEPGINGWLRRNSGILSLLSVLALCLIAGLLIGHWASGGTPGNQVVEIKGLPAGAALPASPAASATPAKAAAGKAKGASKAEEEAEEKTEANETAAEKAPPPAPKKVNLKKLGTTTGKKHIEEIEAATSGGQPIETG